MFLGDEVFEWEDFEIDLLLIGLMVVDFVPYEDFDGFFNESHMVFAHFFQVFHNNVVHFGGGDVHKLLAKAKNIQFC